MMMGLTAVPLILGLGVGIDMSRLVVAKAALQHAADRAALAGATAYKSDQARGDATTMAYNYFDHSAQGMDATVTSRTSVAGLGQLPTGTASFNVTFDATATMPTTLLAIAGVSPMTITVHAVATNPSTSSPTSTAGIADEQPVVTPGPVQSSAMDWNSVYMYGVPNGSDGKPDYTLFPPLAQFWEVGSNCNSINSNWTSQSRCNGQFGAVVPTTQNFPKVPTTQPLAFLFVNMNNGELPSNNQGYGANQYGAAPGNFELQRTSSMSLGQTPSQNTDASVATVRSLTGFSLNQVNTHYSTLNGTAKPNCAIQIQLVEDPNNPPRSPPYPGECFSTTDPRSGYQYANMSCAQMAGRTFMYWWNDMGATKDDYDYKNLYFTVRCDRWSTTPNGGTLYTGPVPIGKPVTLIQ